MAMDIIKKLSEAASRQEYYDLARHWCLHDEAIDEITRLRQLADYLEDPQVLLQIPQPHRLRISELLHSAAHQ